MRRGLGTRRGTFPKEGVKFQGCGTYALRLESNQPRNSSADWDNRRRGTRSPWESPHGWRLREIIKRLCSRDTLREHGGEYSSLATKLASSVARQLEPNPCYSG